MNSKMTPLKALGYNEAQIDLICEILSNRVAIDTNVDGMSKNINSIAGDNPESKSTDFLASLLRRN